MRSAIVLVGALGVLNPACRASPSGATPLEQRQASTPSSSSSEEARKSEELEDDRQAGAQERDELKTNEEACVASTPMGNVAGKRRGEHCHLDEYF